MCLLIDVGNTRVKWGVMASGEIRAGSAFLGTTGLYLSQSFERAWNDVERPARVVACNVAGLDIARQIKHWIRARWKLDVEFVRPQPLAYGVEIAYSDPSKLGADRWACLLALRRCYALPACVVDCGTAITLDVLSESGRHLGGVIAPGLQLMKRSLLQGTSGIVDSSSGEVRVLADNTATAIHSGTVLAAAGLVEKVMRQWSVDSDGLRSLVLTGGDAEWVAPHLSSPLVMKPDLVLQGLAVTL